MNLTPSQAKFLKRLVTNERERIEFNIKNRYVGSPQNLPVLNGQKQMAKTLEALLS